MTSVNRAIVLEIYRSLELLGADNGLLGTVGSWGDSLPEEDVLANIKGWNELFSAACSQTVAPPPDWKDCKHPFVWPNGDCVDCGVLATTMPGHTEPHHIMVPRKFAPLLERRGAAPAGSTPPSSESEVMQPESTGTAKTQPQIPGTATSASLKTSGLAGSTLHSNPEDEFAPKGRVIPDLRKREHLCEWLAVSTPRCPKCGQSDVPETLSAETINGVYTLTITCPECKYETLANKLADFAQFFHPAPSPQRK